MNLGLKSFRRLARNRSGVAMTEFALSLPLLLTAGLYGTETAHLALMHMKVAQVAMQLADDGSRIGDTSTLTNRKIYESDINDLILGSSIQATGLDFYGHGRTIISSLEVTTDGTSQQYIHWQRCKGVKNWASHYGNAGDLVTGMGAAGQQLTAPPGGAVIFVEVAYDYQPLISRRFFGPTTISTTAAFIVRDSRDLTQIYQLDPANPSPVADCSTYSDVPAVNV